jgi:prepilin-type N-terminal cleavage/methylation domain-containing protein
MRNDRGFTLVEVMVALTILVLILTGIFGRLEFAVDTVFDAEREDAATEAAKTIFAELGQTIPLAYGSSDGDLPTGQHWQLLVSPARERSPDRQVGLPEGHNISLTLSWPQHGHAVRLVFETVRLGVEQ